MTIETGSVRPHVAQLTHLRSARISWGRIVAAIALFIAMNRAFAQFWTTSLMHWVIDVGTVEPAAWLAKYAESDQGVVADGSHLRAPDGSINVQYGCEGSDVFMLLASALLVAPIPWRRRLTGLLAGTVLVFVLNQARVLALFYTFRRHSPWFGQLHGLIAPLVVVLVVTFFFLWWIHQSAPRPSHS
jgi:exosortase family protein XrtM